MPTTTHLVVLGVLNVAVIALALYSASAQTATGIIQTLVLGDTLWILWLYTRATFTLAKTAEDQMEFLKAQFVDEKVGEARRKGRVHGPARPAVRRDPARLRSSPWSLRSTYWSTSVKWFAALPVRKY